ncbi:hypothetical protein [Rhodococcus qingshengii]|uniref:Uncharacterized protein n=1 Tax=Rhodococcus qingshengii TaxID=334542 RepID=A0A2A5J5C0_RHOSG|nr:hypothetical protein [Rhodococcus qingshengii]PCK24389.1 hypothetical protein CHR55_26225 [Rhodococcus qingshengii]
MAPGYDHSIPFLFQAQDLASDDDVTRLQSVLTAALEYEQSGWPYPDEVQEAAQLAYKLLEVAAPGVAAELGPPA